MGSKKKKEKLEPLFYVTIGEEISPGKAYLQAASLLDMVALMAIRCGDPEGMGSVAHQWMEMAVLMQGGSKPQEDEEPEESFTETKVVGFEGNGVRREEEDGTGKGNA